MEIKTKHRILGALVVIAAIIIVLPFIQSEKGFPTETTTIKAPTFPDQSQASSDDNDLETQDDTPYQDGQNLQITLKPPQQNTVFENKPPQNEINSQKIEDIKPVVSEKKEQELKSQPITTLSSSKKSKKNSNPISITKPFKPTIKLFIPEAKKKEPFNVINVNGLAQLKKAAWVIQLGNFKNKKDAIQLVNQLRANGYKSFIQQISTTFGDRTQVFVGPLSKNAMAKKLASQLENDLHIHGIVISYKPLEL